MSTTLAVPLLDTPPPRNLGPMQMLLRLAAGQTVEHLSRLFGLTLAEVERRAGSRLIRWTVTGLKALVRLPVEERLGRLAASAFAMIITDIRSGVRIGPAAHRFAERCWAMGRDPGLEVARMVERLLRRVEGMKPDLPAVGQGRRHHAPTIGFPPFDGPGGPAIDRAATVYAYRLRDGLAMAEGNLLDGARRELEAASPEDRPALEERHRYRPYQPLTRRPPYDCYGPEIPGFTHIIYDGFRPVPEPDPDPEPPDPSPD